jgi:hypothetical protein
MLAYLCLALFCMNMTFRWSVFLYRFFLYMDVYFEFESQATMHIVLQKIIFFSN